MTEKDINIEGEETLDEAPVEETAKEAADEEVKSEEVKNEEAEAAEEEKDPLEKAQEQIEELKTQLLYKVAEFENYRSTIWSVPSKTAPRPMTLRCCVRV